MQTAQANPLAEGFARCLTHWAAAQGMDPAQQTLLSLAGQLTSLATQEGHVCCHVSALLQTAAFANENELRFALLATGMVAEASASGLSPEIRPLVLDNQGRLYLHRYFALESRLARNLMERHRLPPFSLPQDMAQQLADLFTHNTARLKGRVDWQRLAAALAARGHLTVISGGPGTGKTTTVVALLACLLSLNPDLRVALAAPTGKAAARMLEALRRQASRLPPSIQVLLPNESFTLHRLLGVTSEPGRFRHHADHPLALDVLVVDEASMLDLALATRLAEAVPAEARLILLGDKDQLAAVEAGAVFAELSANPGLSAACCEDLAAVMQCSAQSLQPSSPQRPTPLNDCAVWFAESHRFAADSGIGRLAAEINAGNGDQAMAWLEQRVFSSSCERRDDAAEADAVRWLPDPAETPSQPLAIALRQAITAGYQGYCDAVQDYLRHRGGPASVFAAFDRFRVLCAVHDTPVGCIAINALMTREMQRQLPAGSHPDWYVGRPVMVTRNDYVLKLFNGDVGLCLPGEQGQPMVYFPIRREDGAETQGDAQAGYRQVAPLRLPPHDTAFAMTVHKSQGSEFDAVMLLLPRQTQKVLSRELLYTGVTRAAKRLILAGKPEVFLAATARPTRRHTGLIDRMQEIAVQDNNGA